jgi:hypothetical protein
VANNGVCETGEPDDSSDCITPVACPDATSFDGTNFLGQPSNICSGLGVCLAAEGSCKCALGYTGDACDRCDTAASYTDVPVDGVIACTRLDSDFEENESVGTPPEGVTPAPPPPGAEKGLGAGAIAGAAIGATAGVAVVGGAAYYLLRVRGARNVGPA